jgi:hypothetical protein
MRTHKIRAVEFGYCLHLRRDVRYRESTVITLRRRKVIQTECWIPSYVVATSPILRIKETPVTQTVSSQQDCIEATPLGEPTYPAYTQGRS